MKELEIWGTQNKTEIGGFYMIGPKEPEQHGCTAYVCDLRDAEELCKSN